MYSDGCGPTISPDQYCTQAFRPASGTLIVTPPRGLGRVAKVPVRGGDFSVRLLTRGKHTLTFVPNELNIVLKINPGAVKIQPGESKFLVLTPLPEQVGTK
jgi:hypothetical protein